MGLADSATEFPRISVVVFVLNAAKTIDRALASVTAPDQPAVELLVLDAGSTDGTLEIIRKYQDKIAFSRSHSDGGAVYAINEGVKRATGDVIALLPADDWLEPGSLHWVREAYARNPDLGVVSCGVRIVHFDTRGEMHEDARFMDETALAFNLERIVRCPLTAARFIPRRLYEQVGWCNPDYLISNDFDFLIKVYLTRPKTAIVPKLTYTYRRHSGSQTMGRNPEMVFRMMRDNIKIAEQHLKHSVLKSDERRALLGIHGRSSARLLWMCLKRGESASAIGVLLEAIRLNWLWPVQVLYWYGEYLLRKPLADETRL